MSIIDESLLVNQNNTIDSLDRESNPNVFSIVLGAFVLRLSKLPSKIVRYLTIYVSIICSIYRRLCTVYRVSAITNCRLLIFQEPIEKSFDLNINSE